MYVLGIALDGPQSLESLPEGFRKVAKMRTESRLRGCSLDLTHSAEWAPQKFDQKSRLRCDRWQYVWR